jgi:16S rRNA processing protein RimM
MYQTITSYASVGKLASTHGLDGNITFIHRLKGTDIFKKVKFIFIELQPESYIPFELIATKRLSDTEAIVRLDGIDSIEKAKKIVGKNIYLPSETHYQLQPEELTMDFKDFALYNQQDKLIGNIIEVIEYPQQLIASVALPNNNEALIPIVEQHIIRIDVLKKSLTLHIPEGLIEIYQ